MNRRGCVGTVSSAADKGSRPLHDVNSVVNVPRTFWQDSECEIGLLTDEATRNFDPLQLSSEVNSGGL